MAKGVLWVDGAKAPEMWTTLDPRVPRVLSRGSWEGQSQRDGRGLLPAMTRRRGHVPGTLEKAGDTSPWEGLALPTPGRGPRGPWRTPTQDCGRVSP